MKLYKKLIAILVIILCFILFYTYARTSFATLTEQSGFYGGLYSYYNVNRIPFGMYNLFIALLSSCVIFMHVKGVLKNVNIFFKKGNWLFLVMAIVLIISEVFLQTRFHGKG